MSDLARNAWRAHWRACSDDTNGPEFGADFGQLLTSNVFVDELSSTEHPDEAAQQVIDASQAADKPIALTTGQTISEAALQATGQLNQAGTAAGPGLANSPLVSAATSGFKTIEYAALGVGALVALYFVSNIAGAVKTLR